jgi:hypothetical protein
MHFTLVGGVDHYHCHNEVELNAYVRLTFNAFLHSVSGELHSLHLLLLEVSPFHRLYVNIIIKK